MADFEHAEYGMTRFPPNVEQITVRHETACSWLIVRRNELELKFPLSHDDRRHLAGLLTAETVKMAQDLTTGAWVPASAQSA